MTRFVLAVLAAAVFAVGFGVAVYYLTNPAIGWVFGSISPAAKATMAPSELRSLSRLGAVAFFLAVVLPAGARSRRARRSL